MARTQKSERGGPSSNNWEETKNEGSKNTLFELVSKKSAGVPGETEWHRMFFTGASDSGNLKKGSSGS